MPYTTVAEIFDEMDGTRERLNQTLEGLTDEQTHFRPAPERWTIAEIIEHLSMVESQVGKLAQIMLAKAEAGGAPRSAEAGRITPFSLEETATKLREQKFQAPELALPKGGLSVSDALERLRASRELLRSLRPRIEAIDASGLIYPHPVLGPLDLYHWLAVTGMHEERHRRQIEALKKEMTTNGE
jgi:hypothetical protein